MFTISDIDEVDFRKMLAWFETGEIELESDTHDEINHVFYEGTTEHGDYSNEEYSAYDSDTGLDYEDDEVIEDEDWEDPPRHWSHERIRAWRNSARKPKDPRPKPHWLDYIQYLFHEATSISELDTFQLSLVLHQWGPIEDPRKRGTWDFMDECRALLAEKLEADPSARLYGQPGVADADDKGSSSYDIDEDDGSAEKSLAIYDSLVALYILADRFDIQELRIDIMNELQAHLHELTLRPNTGQSLPKFETISKAYENLPPSSDLLLWLVHAYAFYWVPSTDRKDQAVVRAGLPSEFLLDVITTIVEKSYCGLAEVDDDEEMPEYQDICNCHKHESEDERIRRERADEGEDKNEDEEDEDDEEEEEEEDE